MMELTSVFLEEKMMGLPFLFEKKKMLERFLGGEIRYQDTRLNG